MTFPIGREPSGRVAIVTGGSRGVGRATVRALAARGYAVVVNYLHDQPGAESLVEEVLASNGAAVAVRADVADELDVERLFGETDAAFNAVDAVVHTVRARVVPTPLAEVDLGVVDALCRINTRAVLIVNREAARWLRNGGAIVNVSSLWRGIASRGYGVYGATTAATDVLTRSLALELRERNITVNAVAVGIDEVAVPHGIAEFIAYLLSADGHRLTGQVIFGDEVDGRGPPSVHRPS